MAKVVRARRNQRRRSRVLTACTKDKFQPMYEARIVCNSWMQFRLQYETTTGKPVGQCKVSLTYIDLDGDVNVYRLSVVTDTGDRDVKVRVGAHVERVVEDEAGVPWVSVRVYKDDDIYLEQAIVAHQPDDNIRPMPSAVSV